MKSSRELFMEHIRTRELSCHCIEVSAIMRALARELGEDEERWASLGLLHDLDFETEKDLATHGKRTADILKAEGYDEAFIRSMLSHNEEGMGVRRESRIDYCLSAADNISGLIYAYALMRKGLDGMEVKGLKKRIKEKSFAAAIRRDLILDIEKAGVPLDKFLEISIRAMQGIAKDIGF
ncbi:MAG: HD domain-containing protein [Candidatus Aenigmarchaeota archaeon]|nr:HD domain-containing protein [Candidatus Aenigmarchaeota archaeon]